MTRVRERLDVQVVFAEPAGVPEGWSRSPLWDRAHDIPGVHLMSDAGSAPQSTTTKLRCLRGLCS